LNFWRPAKANKGAETPKGEPGFLEGLGITPESAAGIAGGLAGGYAGSTVANWALNGTMSWLSKHSDWAKNHASLTTAMLAAGTVATLCGVAKASQCMITESKPTAVETPQQVAQPVAVPAGAVLEAAVEQGAKAQGLTPERNAKEVYKSMVINDGMSQAPAEAVALAKLAWKGAMADKLTPKENAAVGAMLTARELELKTAAQAKAEEVPQGVATISKNSNDLMDAVSRFGNAVQELQKALEERQKSR
jgi:hypothetical protein